MIESELILLGTDYDNEGKSIAYLACETQSGLRVRHLAGGDTLRHASVRGLAK